MSVRRGTREICAVFFDLTGTLLHPVDVAGVYARAGRRHGSRLTAEVVGRHFREAFRVEEEVDAAAGWRTNPAREVERWRRIVARVFDDVPEPDACFRELFAHFARPAAWRLDEDAPAVLAYLRAADVTVGLATNFDRRLGGVIADFPELAGLGPIVLSADVGWRKPAPEFFTALVDRAGLPPGRILLAGDDLVNDYEGARAAGLRAVLLDPRDRYPDVPHRIRRLAALLKEAKE